MSTTALVLVPVDRYRVDYEVGYGAPFSRLDALVLRAMAVEKAVSLAALADAFLLPRRVLIESIVSLSRAGWVAVGGAGEEFTVTRAGELALQSDVLPTPDRVMNRQGSVLVERLTGQVASLRELTYTTTRRLQESGLWGQCRRLQRNENVPPLDAGQAKPLLSRERNEWIRWVGEPIPQQEAWLQLRVDTASLRVSNLPEAWAAGLIPKLSELLGLPELLNRGRAEEKEAQLSTTKFKSWSTAASDVKLVLSGVDHLALLRQALTEAKTQVLVASAFASADVIERDLQPLLLAATARNVRVDLLWGYSAGASQEERDRTLRAFNAVRKACGGSQMLRFNEKPSGSHAKLLLWDDERGRVQACVGSNNWLSMPAAAYGGRHLEVSVLTSHLGVASDICTSVAGIWAQAESGMAGVNDLWHRTASEMERVLALQDGGLEDGAVGALLPTLRDREASQTVTQVRDQEHEALMRDLLLGATRRLGIVSHKLGPKGPVRMASARYAKPAENVQREVQIIVGEAPQADPLLDHMRDLARALPAEFAVVPGVHAKILIADDALLVSSYNFLSADPFGTAEGAREVGLLIRGQHLSDLAWKWMEALGSRANA